MGWNVCFSSNLTLRGDILFQSFMSPYVIVQSLLAYLVFLGLLEITPESFVELLSGPLARLTFGVYLIHPVFLDLLSRSGITEVLNPAAAFITILAGAVMLSFMTTYMLGKVPFIRAIVGIR